MRQDMYEVIIERPRYGGKARRGRRARDADALPIRESMRRTYVVQRAEKEIADNLAPFRRYLIRQVGRPWNKVYSEICAHAHSGSTVQKHLRDHIRDFVLLDPELGPNGRPRVLWGSTCMGLLFVHPRTGLLCRVTRRRKSRH